jgi:hypothetical protein
VNSSGNWSFATSDVAGVDTKLYSLISCSAGYAIKGVNSHTSAGYGIYGETFSLYGTSGKFVGGNFCIELSSPTYNCLMINNLPTGSGTSLVISSGSVMISSSSRRFKSNINPLEHAPEKFAKLQPSYFNYNGEKKITYGLIAEEVNELYPHLVHHENGKPFSVNYDGVSVLALAAAQALKVELDETKNRVSKLENMEV